jgi:hypothetical protein
MECARIRQHLSGFMDDVLDAQTKNLVEKHLLTCKGCKQELESLQSLVQDLGSLESVNAPVDFLERLHDRMAPGFDFGKLMQKLFIPFRIKIPFQFATAAAMAVLIFFIIHTPDMKKEMADISPPDVLQERTEGTDTDSRFESSLEKEIPITEFASEAKAPMKAHSREQMAGAFEETAPLRIATKSKNGTVKPQAYEYVQRAEPAAVKALPRPSMEQIERPVELVLLLKTEVSASDDVLQLDMEMKVPSALEKRETFEQHASDADMANQMAVSRTMKRKRLEQGRGMGFLAKEELRSKDASGLEVLSSDEALSKVKDLVYRVNGTVLSMKYEESTGRPELISAEIPAGQYSFFCEKLQQVGTLQSPPPAIMAKDAEGIKIQIRLIMP